MIGQGSRRSPVRAACAGRPALVDAAVVVRPGVAIDDQTGVARDDMLRLEERARPGWLDARADFPFLAVGELPLAAEFLLRAGAAAIDSLGGKRNRGAGRCWLLPPGKGAEADGDLPLPAASRPADERLAELAADPSLLSDPGTPPAGGPAVARLAPTSGASRPDAPADRVTWRVTLKAITPMVFWTLSSQLMCRTGMRPGGSSALMLMLPARWRCLAWFLVPGRGRMNAAIDVPNRVSFRALMLPALGAARAGACLGTSARAGTCRSAHDQNKLSGIVPGQQERGGVAVEGGQPIARAARRCCTREGRRAGMPRRSNLRFS